MAYPVEELKILSFNICMLPSFWFTNAIAQIHEDELAPIEQRAIPIARKIMELQPDIVCFQESFNGRANEIMQTILTDYHAIWNLGREGLFQVGSGLSFLIHRRSEEHTSELQSQR